MSTQVTVEATRTLAELARQPLPVIDGEPAWLTTTRNQAAAWVARHGFPDSKHEDWRYLDLKPLLGAAFASPAGSNGFALGAPELDSLLGSDLGGPRLVLVNGRLAEQLCRLVDLPAGLGLRSLASAARTGGKALRRCWAQPSGGYRHAFDALNAALAIDGALVEVSAGTSFEAPIEIVHVTLAEAAPPVSCPRIVILAGAGSSATVVESYIGTDHGSSLTNAHTEVVLGAQATLDHYKLQAETEEAFHLSGLEVVAGRDSRFATHLVAVGARLGRHELDISLACEGAAVDLQGLYLPTDAQCHDNPVRVEHAAPSCTSNQLYKGIVDGAGHGIFNGHVIVHPGADGTDAHQTNKNLLLSDRAEVDTRPRLEIFADDVACTHGAAVGQLDADALFYLRSRGIPERTARALLISGFAQEVLERFADGPIRERADRLVTAHLDDGAADRRGITRGRP
jgi:Fe-S cluster assembly protein SufD